VQAARAVWVLDRQANSVVPVLVEALKDPSLRQRGAREAMSSRPGMPAKQAFYPPGKSASDPGRHRRQAIETLGPIRPAAKAAVPGLREEETDSDSDIRRLAGEALKKIDSQERK